MTTASLTHLDPPPPFEAYRGPEPYLFLSYSHRDKSRVYPEIERLHLLGYRIWYDEGIAPAAVWTDALYQALERSAAVLLFLSPAAAESAHVRKEVNTAINHLQKALIAVYLDRIETQSGLTLLLSDLQSILRFELSGEEYRRRLERALPSSTRSAGASARADQADQAIADRLEHEARGCLGRNELEQAIAEVTEALRFAPARASLHALRGEALLQQGDAAGARADFDAAIALDPRRAATYYHRARSLFRLGRYAESLADFERAHALDPALEVPRAMRGARFWLVRAVRALFGRWRLRVRSNVVRG